MGVRSIIIALWYGFMWGLKSPYHAYKKGETYGKAIAWIFGLTTLAVYPISVIIGTLIATVSYYRSGGPEG